MAEIKDIGEMKYRVTIEEPTQSRGSAGGFVHTWSTHATRWAARKDGAEMRSNEREESERQVNVKRTNWTMRYLSTVDTTMRLVHDGLVYIIRGVVYEDRKRFMEIQTELKS